ncbi:MAG: radical SAM family heme chaperone HemW [Bacteroidota bacterium]
MAGLYLHIPFCKQRCVYCDFYFVTATSRLEAFTTRLKQEIAYWGTFFGPNHPLETIYFGGGTPSLLPVPVVAELLDIIASSFDTSAVHERTFEINPDDVDLAYLTDLRQTGINRLSIGIQSFVDADLQWMNRAHNATQAHNIVSTARAAGFQNFSADLIFGLPRQDSDAWEQNLKRMVELEIPHLSTYGLTVEPGTPLHKRVAAGTESVLHEDAFAARYQYTMAFMRDAGYAHYEVSSFARSGFRSGHNQLYWQHTNYLGVGPSAHAFWQHAAAPAQRWGIVRSLKKYLDWDGEGAPPLSFKEEVSPAELASEFIMLRLRTQDGLDLKRLASKYSARLPQTVLDQLVQEGLARISDKHVFSLTDRGLLICDTITSKLLAAVEQHTVTQG